MKSVLYYTTQGITALSAVVAASAQNMSYGADNFYRSGLVNIQPISFKTIYDTTIVGNLFTATNLSRTTSSPAIVVGHPMGAVKEQVSNLYAIKMAEQGFITLTLDLPFWGRSDGPQNYVSPDLYTEAYSAAVDHLGTYNFTDRERIGALGICGSGGFVINAAKIDSRIRAVATVSMYDMGAVNRQGLQRAVSLKQRKEVIANASQQRWAEVDGAPTGYTVGAPNEITDESDAVAREFYDFYRTIRGEWTPEGWQRNQTTHPTVTSNVKFLNFYPFNDIETISPRALLIVTGDQSHSREFSETAYRKADNPKELYWVAGANHTDLYDRTELIPFFKLGEFFRENLKQSSIG
ncbi:putative alpha/beta superfamily hydrolase [Fusarium flagelliforme]|uniref:Hydrolase of the alpha/beta superfamily n=1 Tax=Fusarium flagelliforme TaxID=2675880 RepID=A0A395N4D1_9HYPO|nr:putative alpha/beta superfamily hydrolase [Fusarium flagelliforme]KAH7184600.1 putative alpha/beta superfamily hydrolase [Fusarium flagelliforme]RFN54971.1 hydrolase of the alpha/beta superfamily [Fusarium flagelliforme]